MPEEYIMNYTSFSEDNVATIWFYVRMRCALTTNSPLLPMYLCSSHKFMQMCAVKTDKKPNLILSILKNKCPRCRRGNMFKEVSPYRLKTFMRMNERCPVCSQPLDMEPGFYYGTNMVSYVLALLVSVVTFILWALTIGFSLKDSRFSRCR